MKTYWKTLFRMFKKHVSRFLSVVFIVLVSVGFVSGLGASATLLDDSATKFYRESNVSDVIVKSTSTDGFSAAQISALKEKYGAENVNAGTSVDVSIALQGEKQLVRLYFLDEFGEESVNRPTTVETYDGDTAGTAVARSEEADNGIKGVACGHEISLDFAQILSDLAEWNGEPLAEPMKQLLSGLQPVHAIVGSVVRSPLTFSKEGEPSYRNPEDAPVPETVGDIANLITLDNILYLPSDVIPTYADIVPGFGDTPLLAKGDIYVSFSDKDKFSAFSSEYERYLKDQESEIVTLLNTDEVKFISLYDNYSFHSLHAYADKIVMLGVLFMCVFLFITALVVFSTMSRLMEEERSQIACLETMGYSPFGIISRYTFFAFVATVIGAAGAYFASTGLSSLIYVVFSYSFSMPSMAKIVTGLFYFITALFMLFTALFATVWAGGRMAAEMPASLLRPRTPKKGGKVILEKITPLWNRLSFKYKSTLRNVLRYKSRFVMTVVSVAGATGLVLAGLALLDMCLFSDFGSASIIGLALLIVAFAGLLTVVVIYTLTNINVAERNREIATLMVLGYYDKEVTGYIYREIYINTAVGIFFGYFVGLLLMSLVFSIMGFGSLAGVGWYVWLVAPVAVFGFTALVTLILRRKIVSVDMNESLKAVE